MPQAAECIRNKLFLKIFTISTPLNTNEQESTVNDMNNSVISNYNHYVIHDIHETSDLVTFYFMKKLTF